MSVYAYLQKRTPQTWMTPANNLGIRYTGPVLSGQMSTELAHQLAARRALQPGARYYPRTAHYDPVLKSHTGQ
jgi:hypothetical protein